ncbi:MAG: hypothetical protein PVH18_04195 [Chloroflexota bacterium]|jgi:hypothetical protein
MQKLRFLVFLALTAVSLSLAACGGQDSEGNATALPGATSLSSATPSANSVSGGTVASNDTESTSPTPFSQAPLTALPPASFATMLDELGEHQVDVSVSFEGQDATGVPLSFQLDSRESVVLSPEANRLDITVSGDATDGQIESMSLIRFDDRAYLYVPEIGCISGDPDEFQDDMELPLNPRSILEGLSGAQPVNSDAVVNGVSATEFHFDESALPWSSAGSWSVDGTAFVENDSGLLTRVTMTVSGRGDILGDGRTLDGDYEIVIEIDSTVADEAVTVPAACEETLRYPVTADAYDITAIEDFLVFKSQLTLSDIVNLYGTEMPAVGWQLAAEPDVFEELAIINFIRGNESLMITAEVDTDTGIVTVLISP